jgi:hypothetical protein
LDFHTSSSSAFGGALSDTPESCEGGREGGKWRRG